MNEGNISPYYHQEMHTLEGEQYRLTIKVHKSGFREMLIQKVSKYKMHGQDESNKHKSTWLRDWSNYK